MNSVQSRLNKTNKINCESSFYYVRRYKYIVIKNRPCIINDYRYLWTPSGGRTIAEATDIFTGENHTMKYGKNETIMVPTVEKETYPLIDIQEQYYELLDMGTCETFKISPPINPLKDEIYNAFHINKMVDVTVMSSMDEKQIISFRITD